MTASQIIACAIAWTAAIVAITALVATRRARKNTARPLCLCRHKPDTIITRPQQLTEAEYEALAARLEREYSKFRDGRAVPVAELKDEE